MKRKHACWALVLLAAAALCQFAWLHVPQALQGRVWNLSQCVLTLFVLGMVSLAYGWPVRVVCALVAAWQLKTAGCVIAYLWQPYTGRCAGQLEYPLGMAALAASVGLAWLIYRGGRHVG